MHDYDVLERAAAYASAYTTALSERRVFPDPAAEDRLRALEQSTPEEGRNAIEVIEQLHQLGEVATVATAGPRYFGYVTGGALPAGVAASWLAAAWDQDPAEYRLSPLTVRLEQITAGWLLDLLRLPTEASLNYVTGATMGNVVGLAAARGQAFSRLGWDVHAKGMNGAPPLRILVGEEVHATVIKALVMLGFGRDEIERIPVDRQGRIRADAVPALGPDCILSLQAGNVNSGAFDPFAEIIPKARAAGAWVHIDGAFGLVAAVSPRYDGLLQGHDLADSWAFDGHKWINTPYDCGVAVCRHPEAVERAFSYAAAYLQAGAGEPRSMTLELSRRARSVEMYAILSTLGRKGLRELVERCCVHAQRFAEGLQVIGFEILNDVVLNQCVAAIPGASAADIQRLCKRVEASGEAWFGSTLWQGRHAIRLSVSSWATTKDDVDRTLNAIRAAL